MDISTGGMTDQDIVELVVAVASPNFEGRISIVDVAGACSRLADTFRNFPTHIDDHRSIVLGVSERDNTVRFALNSANRRGGCTVTVELTTDGNEESLKVVIPAVASSIDQFVNAIELLEQPGATGIASLNVKT